MNHTDQRIWLIKELQRDESQLSDYPIPNDEQVINIFESVQGGHTYFFVHTESITKGRVYLFNNKRYSRRKNISFFAIPHISIILFSDVLLVVNSI